MKTRHQKAQLEREGVPPTPPQQLETTTRPKRNTRSTAIRAESSEAEAAPPSISAITSTQGGRISKRGQTPKTTKPKAAKKKNNTAHITTPNLEDRATQFGASIQNDAASEVLNESDVPGNAMDEGVVVKEDTSRPREAPLAPERPFVAQPVQVSQNMTLSSAAIESPATPPETFLLGTQIASPLSPSRVTSMARATVSAQSALPGSASSDRPLSATAAMFKEANERIEQEYSPECPRILPHDSPTDLLTVKAVKKAKGQVATARSTLLSQNKSGTHTADGTLLVAAPDLATNMVPQQVCSTPKQFPRTLSASVTDLPDPSQFVYNFPQPGEQKLHTIMKFCLDIKLVEQLRKEEPLRQSALDIAIPSSMLPDLLLFIAHHPDARNSVLQNLTTANPIARFVTNELTNDAMAGKVRSRREPPANRNDLLPDPIHQVITPRAPLNSQQITPIHSLRDKFGAAKARELRERQALKEMNAQARGSDQQPPSERSTTPVKAVTQWYDEKGNLTLGVFKEVPIEPAREDLSDEEISDDDTELRDRIDEAEDRPVENVVEESRNLVQTVPETPRNRVWGLGKFLPSAARSVSRFIPGFSRQATSTPNQSTQSQRAAATEPRPHVSVTQGRPTRTNAAGVSASRHDTAKRMLLTKGEAEARRKAKKERKWYEEQLEKMRQENAKKEETIKQLQLKAYQAARGGTETNPFGMRRPGDKRKRAPSPETIPNPKGASYGMDLDYFGYDSDDDNASTVSHPPSSKRQRLSASGRGEAVDSFNQDSHTPSPGVTPSDEVIGDPRRARPYTGTMFAIDDTSKQHQGGNIFGEQASPEKAASAHQTPAIQTNSFKVPSPGDSDDEYEYDESYIGITATPTRAPTASLLTTPTPNQAPSHSTTPASSPLKSKPMSPAKAPKASQTVAPPSRFIEQPSTSASATAPSASEISLNIQRERALKYAAKTPSRLQQSSRLSTSTVTSDVQEDEEPAISRGEAGKSLSTETAPENSQEMDIRLLESYYEHQENVSERVTELIERSWDDADTEAAGTLFEEEFEAFVKQEQAPATSSASGLEQQQISTTTSQVTLESQTAISARVQSFINNKWTAADTAIAGDKFASELAAFQATLNIPTLTA
ncbi:MAG: hypothetical protein Q9217_000726 [Psora testacea]